MRSGIAVVVVYRSKEDQVLQSYSCSYQLAGRFCGNCYTAGKVEVGRSRWCVCVCVCVCVWDGRTLGRRVDSMFLQRRISVPKR